LFCSTTTQVVAMAHDREQRFGCILQFDLKKNWMPFGLSSSKPVRLRQAQGERVSASFF